MASVKSRKKKGTKRRQKRKAPAEGIAHIHATFSNTIITITDKEGNVVTWSSSGNVGYRGSRKSTPFAAKIAAEKAGKTALNMGMKTLEVWMKGPGGGRETATRALNSLGFKITSLKDVTPLPHNGCRPPKKKRN
ncbi:MAG: 30S ribosomal protein S11 [bacterium]